MSSKENLENLARGGSLKAEPTDLKECEGLLHSAIDRLKDAHSFELSELRYPTKTFKRTPTAYRLVSFAYVKSR